MIHIEASNLFYKCVWYRLYGKSTESMTHQRQSGSVMWFEMKENKIRWPKLWIFYKNEAKENWSDFHFINDFGQKISWTVPTADWDLNWKDVRLLLRSKLNQHQFMVFVTSESHLHIDSNIDLLSFPLLYITLMFIEGAQLPASLQIIFMTTLFINNNSNHTQEFITNHRMNPM